MNAARCLWWLATALTISLGPALGREAKPPVVFTSECSCEGDHGESRWKAKTDPASPPANHSEIQALRPSDIYAWSGRDVPTTRKQDRIASENLWYSVTGRVAEIRAEEDGDLHIVLADSTGAGEGRIVVEIPLESRWCAMRTTVFGWTDTTFPFTTRRGSLLNIVRPQIVTVVGKAFYDVDHSGKGKGGNGRNYDQNLAVWEIHPVMKLETNNVSLAAAAQNEREARSSSPVSSSNVSPTPTVNAPPLNS